MTEQEAKFLCKWAIENGQRQLTPAEKELLSGRQLSDLFDKYRVWNYLYDCYEALHTTGTSYIIEDIDLYIDARKPVTV